MLNTDISYEEAKDPWGCNFGPKRYKEFVRDPERTPMPWDASSFAGNLKIHSSTGYFLKYSSSGFTTGDNTWLPVNENYETINVMTEEEAVQSSWKLYSQLAKLRQKPVFREGNIDILGCTNEKTLGFRR